MTRAEVIEWLRECPHGKGCESSCPLKALRELPDRAQAYRELLRKTHEQSIDIEQAHKLCPRHVKADECGDG